jgi:uncharacterized protein YndB with AHSA1/START domain
MPSIRKEIRIEASPEQVWAAVRDVGAVHRRLVPGYTADTRIEGDTRLLLLSNGDTVRESIVDVDDEARRMAYAVKESRTPLRHHHATFQVVDEGDGGSRLVWITDFLPRELAPEIRMRIERGASIMKMTIEAAKTV